MNSRQNPDGKVDMLNGPLSGPLIAFAVPLIMGGVLQQSFNSVDIAVAGRFAGSDALAAVGSNGPVIGLIINLFLGLSIGVNVVIANYTGRRDSAGAAAASGVSSFLALACGLLMMLITLLVAEPMLELLGTPPEVLPLAVEYLRIYALGMPFILIFTFGSAVLRSVGDTRRPFYSLVAAGIVNVGLNFLFVAAMGMGVTGVAWGTVISNIINAAVIVVLLLRERSEVRLIIKNVRWIGSEARKIASIGLPAGLQSTVFSISNVFILSAINTFGAKASAGSAAALVFEGYSYFIIVAFAQTATAFASQNFGAGQNERIRSIYNKCLMMCTVATCLVNVGITAVRYYVLMPFTDDPQVLLFGAERMAIVFLFQFIASYYEVAGGVMRGLGHSMTPALITIFGTCVLRLIWLAFLPVGASFTILLAVYPASWLLTDIMMAAAMRRIRPLFVKRKSPRPEHTAAALTQ